MKTVARGLLVVAVAATTGCVMMPTEPQGPGIATLATNEVGVIASRGGVMGILVSQIQDKLPPSKRPPRRSQTRRRG